jgi:hypothetical protein
MTQRRKIVRFAGLAGLALALMAGCARTSVQDVQMTAPGLPRPQLILVHDFATSPSAVALDQAVGARLLRMANEQPIASDEEKVAEIARIVTQHLVKEIKQLGIPAQPGTIGTPPVAGPVLAVAGRVMV